MINTLLASGDLKDFTPVGEGGYAVYLMAPQIRETFRRRLGKDADGVYYSDYLAMPKRNTQGNIINWYISFDVPNKESIVKWTEATEEQKEAARLKLTDFYSKVMDLGLRMQEKQLTGDQLLFSQFIYDPELARSECLSIPEEKFAYIVNGIPVLTFWGFVNHEDRRKDHPLAPLFKQSALVASLIPNQSVANFKTQTTNHINFIEKKRFNWRRLFRWLLWLLCFLLLLCLCFFLLRTCVFNKRELIIPRLQSDHQLILPVGEDGLNVKSPSFSSKPNIDMSFPNDDVTFPDASVPDLDLNPNLPSVQNAEPSFALPNQENENAGLPPVVMNDTPPENMNSQNGVMPPVMTNEAGNLSSDYLQSGNASNLSGAWMVKGGIQDKATGKPLRLMYHFDQGKGTVTIKRKDGVTCIGQVQATSEDGGLNIVNDSPAVCDDKSTYNLPPIKCAPGASSAAECSGNYGNTAFPITMKQNN